MKTAMFEEAAKEFSDLERKALANESFRFSLIFRKHAPALVLALAQLSSLGERRLKIYFNGERLIDEELYKIARDFVDKNIAKPKI